VKHNFMNLELPYQIETVVSLMSTTTLY
jgi:hypothetical protein